MSVLLTRNERRRLINLLLRIPISQNLYGRLTLLGGLPLNLIATIPETPDARTHRTTILDLVDSAAWVVLPDGTRPVTIIIENARDAIEGTRLAEELTTLLDAVLGRPLPVALAAAVLPDTPSSAAPLFLAELHQLVTDAQARLNTALTLLDRWREHSGTPE